MNDALKKKLTELGLDAKQVEKLAKEGVTDEAGMTLLSGDDIKSVTGCGLVTARQIAAAFVVEPEVDATVSTETFNMVLPTVPTDESFLKALATGGVLKVEQSTVISAIRAALAFKVGLYDAPAKLVKAMEAYTDETEEQVGEEFFRMRKMLTRSEYGDLFAAIEGMDGSYVTAGRKKEMLARIDSNLWPAVMSFANQLDSWQDAWMKGAANPAMLMAAMVGGRGGMMPPGFGQAPDTAALRDAALAVNDSVNKVFRGTGVQISAALAYEANRIKDTLNRPNLHTLIGAPNREQMLKKLGLAIPATYPRLETNLTQFVLGIMQAEDQPAGDEELRYFSAMQMLASQIDWNQLSGGSSAVRPAGLGRADVSGRHRVGDDA